MSGEESALRENIARKGSNSYYYAHGTTPKGPAWDGKEEPRLLVKSEKVDVEKALPILVAFPEYGWADEKKSVKIYIEYAEADSVPDIDVVLERKGTDAFEFSVKLPDQNKMYRLSLDQLNGSIEAVSYKKKTDKFILTLKKEAESSWYQLRKK